MQLKALRRVGVLNVKQYFSGYFMNLVVFGLGRTWMDIPLEPETCLGPSGTLPIASGFSISSSQDLPSLGPEIQRILSNTLATLSLLKTYLRKSSGQWA